MNHQPIARAAGRGRRASRGAAVASAMAVFGVLALASPASADPPANSSFESPDVPAGPTTVDAPSSLITGWNVVSGSVDLQDQTPGPVDQPAAADGEQYIDLNGNAPGVIQQSFPTVAGTGYTISWSYGDSWRGAPACEIPKAGTFSVEGAAVETMSVTGTLGDANWQTRSTTFTGTGGDVLLQFAGTSEGFCGLALDNVQIGIDAAVPLVDPEVAVGLVGAASLAAAVWFLQRRRTTGSGAVVAG